MTAPYCCITDGEGFCCTYGCADPTTGDTCSNSVPTTEAPTAPSPPGVTTTAAPPTTAAPAPTSCPTAPSNATTSYSAATKPVVTLNLTSAAVPSNFTDMLSALLCVPSSALALSQPTKVDDATTAIQLTFNCGFDACNAVERMNYLLWLASTNPAGLRALGIAAVRQGALNQQSSTSNSDRAVSAAAEDTTATKTTNTLIGVGAAVAVVVVLCAILAAVIAYRRRQKIARRNNLQFTMESPSVQTDASPYLDRRPRVGVDIDDVVEDERDFDGVVDMEMEPDVVVEFTPSKSLVH